MVDGNDAGGRFVHAVDAARLRYSFVYCLSVGIDVDGQSDLERPVAVTADEALHLAARSGRLIGFRACELPERLKVPRKNTRHVRRRSAFDRIGQVENIRRTRNALAAVDRIRVHEVIPRRRPVGESDGHRLGLRSSGAPESSYRQRERRTRRFRLLRDVRVEGRAARGVELKSVLGSAGNRRHRGQDFAEGIVVFPRRGGKVGSTCADGERR